MFWCRKVRRVKDEKGRRQCAREGGVQWDGWVALASKKWVRMEDSGQVDGDGKPILKRVDLTMDVLKSDQNHVTRKPGDSRRCKGAGCEVM